MIDYLRLSGIGVVSEAEIDLAGGLTVLTGETGAGKTVVLSALGLLLGAKPASGLATSPQARVEGGWTMPEGHPVLERAGELGAHDENGHLIISRSLPPGGRGRCQVGGVGVPATVLTELAEQLVAVHGQADQLLLRRPAAQRALLDRFAGPGLAEILAEYRQHYQEVVALDERFAATVADVGRLEVEIAGLREGLELIAEVDPIPGETAQLREEVERLGRVDELRQAVSIVVSALSDEGPEGLDVRTVLAQAGRAVQSVSDADSLLGQMSDRLADLLASVEDVALDARRYVDGLEADPGRLAHCQERLAQLADLCRRYGPDIESVLIWGKQANSRLLELEDALDVDRLRNRREAARAALTRSAAALHEAREEAAGRLAAAVEAELRDLAMPKARLEVAVSLAQPRSDQDPLAWSASDLRVGFGPDGVDDVVLLLSPHPGAKPAPIARAASGGELSRVMLALEVVLAAEATAPTFVFDEVDAGIGGQTAVEVGRRLARLARQAQVLVVTHLAQVAAFADDHLVIEKSVAGEVTTSNIRHVRGEERQKEIARMLSGQTDSRHALAHAAELLGLAAD